MPQTSPLIAGIGSALVDILIHESDDFLAQTQAAKGGMTLVDSEVIESILSKTKAEQSIVPGGSACNTIVGIGRLGAAARFIGKCGPDLLGNTFIDALRANNVDPVLEYSETEATGRVLSVITPDAQRTMFTCLGAASQTTANEITGQKIRGAAIVHIEGYLLFNEALIRAALQVAKEEGAKVSLDLASFTVVESQKTLIAELVRDYVDILIANEDEARTYTGIADESESLRILGEHVEIAVLKLGRRGSLVLTGGVITPVEPVPAPQVVDTTGAGDLWAAGFLYGLAHGFPVDRCGQLASACGSEVVRVVGAHIPEDGWRRIRELLN